MGNISHASRQLVPAIHRLIRRNEALANDDGEAGRQRFAFRRGDHLWAAKRTWQDELAATEAFRFGGAVSSLVQVPPPIALLGVLTDVRRLTADLGDSACEREVKALFGLVLAEPVYRVRNATTEQEAQCPGYELSATYRPLDGGLLNRLLKAARTLERRADRRSAEAETPAEAAAKPGKATKRKRGGQPGNVAEVAQKIIDRNEHNQGLGWKRLAEKYEKQLGPGYRGDNLRRAVARVLESRKSESA